MTIPSQVIPQMIRNQLPAYGSLPPHRHPGRQVSLAVLEGDLRVTLEGQTRTLQAGEELSFSGEQSVALLAGAGGANFTVTMVPLTAS